MEARVEGSEPAALGAGDALLADLLVWRDRVGKAAGDPSGSIVLAHAGNELAGMVGVWRGTGVKTRLEANIWGVYVRPKYRGLKLTDGMIAEALGWCRGGDVRIVRLGVGTYNAAAIRCYQRCGFLVCGISPEKIRVGDVSYDELLMWRRVYPRSMVVFGVSTTKMNLGQIVF